MPSTRCMIRAGAVALFASVQLFAAEATTPVAPAAPEKAPAAAPTPPTTTPAATPAPAAPPAPPPPVADQPPAAPRARTSPHETVSTVVGDRRTGIRLTLTYGRPFSKHPRTGEMRKIWGGLVPWDKPDRLGADEATLLLTPVSLKFGDTTVPAGAYTLYIVPSENGTTFLAFSSALGKWGIPVDTTKDVARVALEKHALQASIDQLSLAIEGQPDGSGGFLKIAWEQTLFTAPFTLVR